MFGAIAGDVIGSVYEWHATKSTEFPLFSAGSSFTDGTVLTVAVADAILAAYKPGGLGAASLDEAYACKFREYGHKYPDSGYGGRFAQWLSSSSMKPYNSFGNGSAMRASPVGFAFDTVEEVLRQAKRSAVVTHNHREGVKGAQATAAAVFLARTGHEKSYIKHYIERTFRYDLSRTLEDIRPTYAFDETCQGSVPEAIIAFLESDNFEDAIRKAISLGGDSDTLACITGGIAQAFYKKIPKAIYDGVQFRLDSGLKRVIREFNMKYNVEFDII
jgi:ADP-ribosylglycohydrolase